MVITIVIISWVSLYSTWTISQCLKWEMLLFLEEEIKGHITDRGRARICTAAVLSKLACCHKVDRYMWWLSFFFSIEHVEGDPRATGILILPTHSSLILQTPWDLPTQWQAASSLKTGLELPPSWFHSPPSHFDAATHHVCPTLELE